MITKNPNTPFECRMVSVNKQTNKNEKHEQHGFILQKKGGRDIKVRKVARMD
jgi:hypothetical protein